jgi:hypothetical protein
MDALGRVIEQGLFDTNLYPLVCVACGAPELRDKLIELFKGAAAKLTPQSMHFMAAIAENLGVCEEIALVDVGFLSIIASREWDSLLLWRSAAKLTDALSLPNLPELNADFHHLAAALASSRERYAIMRNRVGLDGLATACMEQLMILLVKANLKAKIECIKATDGTTIGEFWNIGLNFLTDLSAGVMRACESQRIDIRDPLVRLTSLECEMEIRIFVGAAIAIISAFLNNEITFESFNWRGNADARSGVEDLADIYDKVMEEYEITNPPVFSDHIAELKAFFVVCPPELTKTISALSSVEGFFVWFFKKSGESVPPGLKKLFPHEATHDAVHRADIASYPRKTFVERCRSVSPIVWPKMKVSHRGRKTALEAGRAGEYCAGHFDGVPRPFCFEARVEDEDNVSWRDAHGVGVGYFDRY